MRLGCAAGEHRVKSLAGVPETKISLYAVIERITPEVPRLETPAAASTSSH